MTSKLDAPNGEDAFDGGLCEIINTSGNNFESSKSNLEELQPTEEDLCIPINNGNGLLSKSNFGSQNSLRKGSGDLLEKNEKTFYAQSNIDNSISKKGKKLKSDGDKKTGFGSLRHECENKIRQKLGLTHNGYLIGLLLLSATILLLLVIIVLAVCWPQIPHRQRFPICTKATCLKSSALILSKLDRNKSPCDDFYGFACGKLVKKHAKPPESRAKWNLEEEINLKMSELTRDVISVLPHQTRTNSLTWKIKNFYDSCMSLDNIETDNERPLRKIINELGGWSVLRNFQVLSWDFSKTLVKLHDEFGVMPFFTVSVVSDPRNASKNIIQLYPSGLGLPDSSYYYREKDDKISSSYCRYMKDVSRQLGATSTDANSFSQDMFYFERRIAEATPSPEELEDVRNHQILAISQLKIIAPSVPLHEILDAMFNKANMHEDTEVLLPSLAYLTKISTIIATTDRSALNNFVIWNLVKKYLPYLSQNFQDIYYVYYRDMSGATSLIDRWEFCVKTLWSFMDVGLAGQIGKSTSETERNNDVETISEIFRVVRQVVRDSITRAPWIDLELYKHYISKLDNMTVQVGFPQKYLDVSYLEAYYSKLYVQKNNFFQNILYGVSYMQEDLRRRYVSNKEEYRWLSQVASQSQVEFIPSINKVVVPQKLLLKPYFESEYPAAVLYGTLGVQISRELVSSLLKYTGLFAANGSLVTDKSLVANLTLMSTDPQLKCLSRLTAQNVNVTDERANKTSLTTFTDISAVKQALKALKKVSANSEHIHQAGLEDFDDDSLFYIAYGQSLFSQKTEQEEDKKITTSRFLDGKQLLELVQLQMKSFAEAFGCSVPKNSCKHVL